MLLLAPKKTRRLLKGGCFSNYILRHMIKVYMLPRKRAWRALKMAGKLVVLKQGYFLVPQMVCARMWRDVCNPRAASTYLCILWLSRRTVCSSAEGYMRCVHRSHVEGCKSYMPQATSLACNSREWCVVKITDSEALTSTYATY